MLVCISGGEDVSVGGREILSSVGCRDDGEAPGEGAIARSSSPAPTVSNDLGCVGDCADGSRDGCKVGAAESLSSEEGESVEEGDAGNGGDGDKGGEDDKDDGV